MERKLNVPIKDENLSELNAGDVVYLTGNILTARDQAHKRLLEQGAPLDIEGAVLFHAGPIISKKDDEYETKTTSDYFYGDADDISACGGAEVQLHLQWCYHHL